MTRRELIERSGATKSQLIHWTALKLLPSLNGTIGSGNHWEYSEADLHAARAAADAAATFGPSAGPIVLRRILKDGPPRIDTAPSKPVVDTPWLNTKEAAAYLKRGRRFVLQEVAVGRLRAAKVGGRGEILTRAEWCDEWVTEQATPRTLIAQRYRKT